LRNSKPIFSKKNHRLKTEKATFKSQKVPKSAQKKPLFRLWRNKKQHTAKRCKKSPLSCSAGIKNTVRKEAE